MLHRWKNFCRAPEGSGGGGAPAVPATPAVVADATPAIPAADAVAAPSHGDWAGMAKTMRATQAQTAELAALVSKLVAGVRPEPETPATRPTAGSNAAEVAEMRARLALNEALDDLGIPMTKGQKETVRKLQKVDSPTDVGDWLARTVDTLGIKRTPQVAVPAVVPASAVAAPAAPAAPVKPFELGVMSSGQADRVPLDPMAIPQSVADAMTPAQALEWYQRYKAQGGANQHPFRGMREAEKAAGSTAETARQIAVALSGLQNK